MKEIFNINRFFKLVQKESSERLHMMLKISAIFAALITAYWLFIIIFSNGESSSIASSRLSYIYVAVVITMLLAPFNLYKNYNHRKSGLDYVLLPASILEKYISMLINSVILLPLFTLFLTLLTDTIITTISPKIFIGYAITNLDLGKAAFQGYAEVLIVQLGFIYCNLMFRKYKVTKTVLSIIGLYSVFAAVLVFLVTVVFKSDFEMLQRMGTTNSTIRINGLNDLIKMKDFGEFSTLFKTLFYSWQILFWGLLPAWFLSGSYYRMKNLQY